MTKKQRVMFVLKRIGVAIALIVLAPLWIPLIVLAVLVLWPFVSAWADDAIIGALNDLDEESSRVA